MSPIVYELGLVVGGLVVFVVWQTVTLRRDMRITRQRRAEAAGHASNATAASTPECVRKANPGVQD